MTLYLLKWFQSLIVRDVASRFWFEYDLIDE
jgi:hypothetical protein